MRLLRERRRRRLESGGRRREAARRGRTRDCQQCWRSLKGEVWTHEEDGPRVGKGGCVVVGALAGGGVDVAVEGALGKAVCVVRPLIDGRTDAAVVGIRVLGHGAAVQ